MAWVKLPDTILDDHRIQQLAPDVFRTWVNLLALAKRHPRGLLPGPMDIAFALRIGTKEVQSHIATLVANGLLVDANGRMTPTKMEEPPPRSGTGSRSPVARFHNDGVPVETIPLRDGTVFTITDTLAREMAGLFPQVDIMAELRAMRAWCIASPDRQKTARGVLRFVTAWIAKSQRDAMEKTYAKTSERNLYRAIFKHHIEETDSRDGWPQDQPEH